MPKHTQARPNMPKYAQARPSMPKHAQACPSTQNNYWEHMETFWTLKNMKSLISKKRLTEEEERRTKQSLDSPQTIEANKKI